MPPPAGTEPLPSADEKPAAFAVRAAEAKAFAALPEALALCGQKLVLIAADTVVVHEGQILGKPSGKADALRMLRFLSGHTHRVATGCAVLCLNATEKNNRPHANYSAAPDEIMSGPGKKEGIASTSFAVVSEVSMWDAPEAALRAYIAGGEPMDKAGAYAVQGAGAFLVNAINGSWSNVVGLPLAELVEVLLQMRAIAPAPPTS